MLRCALEVPGPRGLPPGHVSINVTGKKTVKVVDLYHRNEHIPAFAFPAAAGIHLPAPEGWKAE